MSDRLSQISARLAEPSLAPPESSRGILLADLAWLLELVREYERALAEPYKIASSFMPCEDAWDEGDPLVRIVRSCAEALKRGRGE
jgi:hypothetical protein